MKKILFFPVVILTSLLFTNSAFASIDANLKYGQTNLEIRELQEFLVDKGFLSSNPTGFFGLLTLKAVKAYQTSEGLPSTGYVGAMTREKVNEALKIEISASNSAEIQETGTNTPVSTVNQPAYTAPVYTPTVTSNPVTQTQTVQQTQLPSWNITEIATSTTGALLAIDESGTYHTVFCAIGNIEYPVTEDSFKSAMQAKLDAMPYTTTDPYKSTPYDVSINRSLNPMMALYQDGYYARNLHRYCGTVTNKDGVRGYLFKEI